MPPSKKSCSDCSVKMRRCTQSTVKRKSEDMQIAIEGCSSIIRGGPKRTCRKNEKPNCTRMVRSTPSTNNNRFGINQFQFSTQSSRKQKIKNAAVHNSPDKKICPFLGSVLSKSDEEEFSFRHLPTNIWIQTQG